MTTLTLTQQQAADLLGISTSTFDKWVRKGVAPAAIRGTRRWSQATLERAMSGHHEGPSTESNGLSPFEEWKRNTRPL